MSIKRPDLFEALSDQKLLASNPNADISLVIKNEALSSDFTLRPPPDMKSINWMHLLIAMYASRRVLRMVLPDERQRHEWINACGAAITNLSIMQQGPARNPIKNAIKGFIDNNIGEF
jgi:hypothetical protein